MSEATHLPPERLSRLNRKLAGLTRTAWVPVVEAGAGDPAGSKLGGVPWLEEGKAWPRCKGCKRPMHLLLQLRGEDVPDRALALPEGSLLQVFHCGRGYPCDEGYGIASPGGRGAWLRVVQRDARGGAPADAPEGLALEKRIVGWTPREELPGHGDTQVAGLRLNAKELRWLSDHGPHGRSKLGGHADWIQSPHAASCPKCGAAMAFALQLASGEHIAVDFGDSGLGYVLQCQKHPDRLVFAWSST